MTGLRKRYACLDHLIVAMAALREGNTEKAEDSLAMAATDEEIVAAMEDLDELNSVEEVEEELDLEGPEPEREEDEDEDENASVPAPVEEPTTAPVEPVIESVPPTVEAPVPVAAAAPEEAPSTAESVAAPDSEEASMMERLNDRIQRNLRSL